MWKILGPASLVALFWSNAALAYIGPGAGAGSLAVIIGIFASIGLAIVALVWYPLKRILKHRKTKESPTQPDAEKEAK